MDVDVHIIYDSNVKSIIVSGVHIIKCTNIHQWLKNISSTLSAQLFPFCIRIKEFTCLSTSNCNIATGNIRPSANSVNST